MNLQQLKSETVAVLLGGKSAEREISLLSGATIVSALESAGYTVLAVDPADAGWTEALDGVSFVFNALHGPGGEDGVMQGALEVLGIAYSGSGVLGSALAMDKKRSKQLWQGIGLLFFCDANPYQSSLKALMCACSMKRFVPYDLSL